MLEDGECLGRVKNTWVRGKVAKRSLAALPK
jgi:hypothetical protein